MFTSIDKALVGTITGLFTIATAWGFDVGINEQTALTIAGALTPLLVWLVPNRRF